MKVSCNQKPEKDEVKTGGKKYVQDRFIIFHHQMF